MRFALFVLLFTGCATVTPLQTASVVAPRHVRAGGQVSFAAFCGSIPSGGLGVSQCTEYPDGVPLPEVRLSGRVGLARGFDLGVSAQALGQVVSAERALQLGLTVDVKGELLRIATKGPTHIVSVGFLGGTAVAGRLGLPLWTQSEWGVPVFYGLQFAHVELVASAFASQRVTVSPNLSPSTDTVRVGLSLGLFRREPAGWAVQVGYLTDPSRFSLGSIQVQVGWLFDLQ